MIVEFMFFICIAAICFSGLLFTLWDLASGTWTVGETAWLMIQIWFGWSSFLFCFTLHWTVLCPFAGNTWLSFGQASSFHAVFVSPLDECIWRLCPLILTLGPASHGPLRSLVEHTSHYQSVFFHASSH